MSHLYVTTPGAYLRKSGGRLVVQHRDATLAEAPLAAVDAVVLFGPVQVSTQAMHELLEAGISMTLLSRSGRFLGILQSGLPKNTFVRMAQMEASRDEGLALANARSIVEAKSQSQAFSLALWRRCHWLEAEESAVDGGEVSAAETVTQVQLSEARLARRYFALFGQALPPAFPWVSRTRRPPRDPVNALLSLTYMMAVSEAVSACYNAALDPFVGFLHQLDYGRPSMALDLIEPLRPRWCDHFVLRLLQQERFLPEDFQSTPATGCRLKPVSVRRYFEEYDIWAGEAEGTRSLRSVLASLARESVEACRRRRTFAWSEVVGGAV